MAKNLRRLLAAVLAIAICAGIALPAFADEPAKAKEYPIDKTANGLNKDDQTDVTLTVPGTLEGNIDVVFILGGGMTANMETIESAINVFKPAMESGKATVRMGLISLEKGKEIILDLNSDEAVLDPATYVDFVTEKFDSINDLPYGTTNLHSQMLEAQKMLAKETKAKAENKYVFVLATGRTYWFDDANGEQATIVNKVSGTYYWGEYLWKSQRGRNTSLYMIPDRYNNSYEAFFADVEKWVANDGDKYVYTPHFDVNDYNAYVTWEQNNNKDLRALGVAGSRYGNGIVNPKPTAENFITGTPAAIGSENHPLNALNYERAQYECVQVWKELVAANYNCYSICSEHPNYQNGSEYIKLGAKYTGTSTSQVGHSFMNYLATLAGQKFAPTVWDYERDAEGNLLSTKTVLQENFFDSVRNDMLYTCSIGSTVEDFIGKNENGNFEFIENADYIKLTVGGVGYTTAQVATKENANSSYAFTAPGDAEPTHWLDYYYGDGETTERFVWTIGENVSMEKLAHLTYKLQLTEKQTEAGEYTVPTNNSATLYPVDSDGNKGEPQPFPVPEVKYEVNPYDVDIVLALGAGIAQYDADNAKGYTHTYDSIVNLVEPLVNQGINVKLGLVAVEHYDDVAMPLTVLTKDNYKTVITDGLNTIQNMPAGPTNLHGNIMAAKAMLDADKTVPNANKFFYVIATGRTYNYDNENGVPTTIINKVSVGGNTHYYWGHYLWQSQRGGHTSLYMIPARYNNDFNAYWADVCKWVEADGDTYAYSFTDAYDTTNPQWFNEYMAINSTDLKAHKIASSRFGWLIPGLKNSGLDAIGSGSNPQNALNYERAQYEAWKAYQAMIEAGYTCEAISSESANYQNGSEYIKQGAKYTGTSTIQLGDSFMDFLNGGEAKNLFDYTRDENGNLISTAAVFKTTDYFTKIDVDQLQKTEKAPANKGPIMMSPAPKQPIVITRQPVDASAAMGETVSVSVEAQGEGLKYQWYIKNAGSSAFSKSSTKTAVYAVAMTKARADRQLYCVITDAKGNTVTTDTVTISCAVEELKITRQPVDVAVPMGTNAVVDFDVTGTGLTYQWYIKNAGGTAFSKSSTTAASYTTTMNKTRHNREIYCVVTDVMGNQVITDTVTISCAVEELKITRQPVDVAVPMGTNAVVTFDVTGTGLTYQWYIKNAGGATFSKSSTTAAAYTTAMNKTRHNRQVYCVITDVLGNTVTTDTVTISCAVEELKITGIETKLGVAFGKTTSVAVSAQGTGLTYTWYIRNAGSSTFSKSSTTTSTYSTVMNASRCNREIYCVITDALGNEVTTEIFTLVMTK